MCELSASFLDILAAGKHWRVPTCTGVKRLVNMHTGVLHPSAFALELRVYESRGRDLVMRPLSTYMPPGLHDCLGLLARLGLLVHYCLLSLLLGEGLSLNLRNRVG